MRHRLLPIALALLAITLSPAVASAATVYTHAGSTSPSQEGWTYFTTGGGQSQSAVGTGGPGDPLAWNLTDAGTGGASAQIRILSQQQVQDALSYGWSLETQVRVNRIAGPGIEDGAMGVAFQPAPQLGTLFGFWLKSDALGNALVDPYPGGGTTYAVGSGGYHTYRLESDGPSGTATLLVDGIVVATGQTGQSGILPGFNGAIGFGSLSTPRHGSIDVASFNFTVRGPLDVVVPEPGSLALACLAAATVLTARARGRAAA